MKKIASIALCAVLFAAVPALVYGSDVTAAKATAPSQQKMGQENAAKPENMDKCSKCEGMKMECCQKCKCHKCGMMKHKCVVATSDGGVVVMMGDKLAKYDKNLNLVKETELKMEEKESDEECPMCKHSEEGKK